MPDVTFTIESDADDWNVFLTRNGGATGAPIFSNPTVNHVERNLPKGNYNVASTIRGTDEKKAKLTVSRPTYKNDVVLNISINPGTGQGANDRTFRV